jgi:hypothetical protein
MADKSESEPLTHTIYHFSHGILPENRWQIFNRKTDEKSGK